MSIALENFPTSSGSLLSCCCLTSTSLIVVDFAWCGWGSGARPCLVALFASAFASDPSVKSVSAGIYMKSREFPPRFSSSADS